MLVSTSRSKHKKPGSQQTMHWAAEIALRLLQERHAQQSDSSFWQPWIASLPERVVTPVEFTEEAVQALVLPSTIQAVQKLQLSVEHCYAELQPQLAAVGCSWHDYLWAVQVLHSRCFLDAVSGCHVAVPGIDMANHSSTAANAAVRVQHSQDKQAMTDGTATAAAAAAAAVAAGLTESGSFFQLVAGPKRISAGEQVCISYGSWPAEPFLLLWGFTPQPNAADAVAVFSSLQDMAACYFDQLEFKLTAGSPAEQLMHSEQFYEAMRLQLAAVNKNSSSSRRFSNMSVDASGIDGQLKDALAVLKSCVVAAAASVLRQQHASSRTTSSSSSSDSTDSRPQHDAAAATGGDSATPGQPTAHCSSDADNTAVQIQQLLQIKLGELLVFRLQGLAHDLDQSCLNCREAIAHLQAHGNSSSSDLGKQRQQQPLRQQQQQQAAEVSDHTLHQRAAAGRSAPGPTAELLAKEAAAAAAADSSRYQPSIEHLELICAYCCSEAALAWELADGYPIMMSGIFLV